MSVFPVAIWGKVSPISCLVSQSKEANKARIPPQLVKYQADFKILVQIFVCFSQGSGWNMGRIFEMKDSSRLVTRAPGRQTQKSRCWIRIHTYVRAVSPFYLTETQLNSICLPCGYVLKLNYLFKPSGTQIGSQLPRKVRCLSISREKSESINPD